MVCCFAECVAREVVVAEFERSSCFLLLLLFVFVPSTKSSYTTLPLLLPPQDHDPSLKLKPRLTSL